jgi:DNA polymerase III subunit alpha
MSDFVHLRVRSHYSFLSGLGKPAKFAERAKELGMSAIALTDVGNLYGSFEFYKACKEAGVSPIIGAEFAVAASGRGSRDRNQSIYRILLLAKGNEGYRNLIQLVSESYLTGYYFEPRVDFELLEKYREDLICLTGSTLGEIPQHVITGKDDAFIRERLRYYQDLYGADDVYLELQEHPDRPNQARVNDALIRMSKLWNAKTVATNDAHYARVSDAESQDLLSCIGSGRSLEDPDRISMVDGDYSVRPAEEMAELFAYHQTAVSATVEIAGKIHLDIPYGRTLIPVFTLEGEARTGYDRYVASLPAGAKQLDSAEWNLRNICIRGLGYRYDISLSEEEIGICIQKKEIAPPEKKLQHMSVEELNALAEAYYMDEKVALLAKRPKRENEIIHRLEYELTVVDLMGFNGYFNIVSDFIGFAKKEGIPVGPGRGSAAGAILAYLSGITDLDPLRYGLLFERFLNPSRISMPDIDVDFSDEGRERVFEYVKQKYGDDHVAQICTFGTMAARAAVKDVGKALGIPFSEMNALAKKMPSKPGTKIKGALEESVEFKQAYDSDPRYRKVVDSAMKLEGSVRQLGVHACAVIIAPEPMTNFCALQHPPKDNNAIVTQLSQYPIEELGLLKMDFLGLRNLTIIDRCLKIVRERHGKDIDMLKIDYEDPAVFRVFAEGDTTGVFQFESAGMRKYLKELKPNVFEDIIVMASLYRPGPMLYIPTYINRKHGREKVAFPHSSLEAILKPTQGIAVYQEQIMQLVQAFAGFSLGEADILRRAIGKKKIDLLMEQKEKFINAALSQGHKKELAKYIFEDIIEPFAGYGFNKSHAACYSMIAYQTAYLKAYHLTEFMTALMVSDEDDTERITMEINECKAHGIEILPPDLNESRRHFTYIDSGNIRFGLKAIKGLGDGPIEAIIEGRKSQPYKSVFDVIERTGSDVVNKKSLEALILSGAMDAVAERAQMLASIPKITAYAREENRKSESSQIGLFDLGAEHSHHRFELEKAEPMSFEEILRHEREVIGYSVSGHGFDGLKSHIWSKTLGKEHLREFQKTLIESRLAMQQAALEAAAAENADHSESTEEGDVVAAETGATGPAAETEVAEAPETAEEKPAEEKKKAEREAPRRVRFYGLVSGVRTIQTKAGKMMMVATCDSADFRFSLVIFPKEYEKYAKIIAEDIVVMVDGNTRLDERNGEVSVMPTAVRTTSLAAFRRHVMEAGQYRPDEKINILPHLEDIDLGGVAPAAAAKPTETEAAAAVPEHVVRIPAHATKDDLVALKEFLLTLPSGEIAVHIDIKGKKIDTKMRVADTDEVARWTTENL